MEYPDDDVQCEDKQITAVEPQEQGGWVVGFDDGRSFFVPADSPVEPAPGMVARLYGKGFGFIVRGLFLDGRRVFYRTEAEQRAEDRRRVEEHDRERRYDFERARADLDRRYRALPEVFRRRLDRFRGANPDFRWRFEPYELFTCEEAVKIAAALGSAVAIDAWRELPHEEQVRRVPLADGHSGNTFGCACLLARLYLTSPEDVVRMHGALTPLVGCAEYGCVHPTEGVER